MASTSAITLLLFSQPCPAPIFAAIGAAASVVQAGVAVDEAVNNKRDLGNKGADKGGKGVAGSKGGDTGTWDNFNECVEQIMYGNQVSTVNRPGYVEISNCPDVCGSFIEEYNASPNIDELNAQYGPVTWADGTLTYTPTGSGGEQGGWGDKKGWKRDEDWTDKKEPEPKPEEPKDEGWTKKKEPEPKEEESKDEGWTDKDAKGDEHKGHKKGDKGWTGWTPRGGSH